jgi:hypothetical protein
VPEPAKELYSILKIKHHISADGPGYLGGGKYARHFRQR